MRHEEAVSLFSAEQRVRHICLQNPVLPRNQLKKSITVRFSTPQIIGYYIETTLPDKSTVIDDISFREASAGFVTVSQFVNDYKELLLNKKQKNNAEQQN